MNYLIVLALLIFTAISIYRRELGVYLIILLLPSYQIRFQVAGLPMTFLESMIFILAAVELFFLAKNRRLGLAFRNQIMLKLRRNLPIFFFLLAAFISIFVSPAQVKAAGIFKAYFLESILFYFLVLLIIDNAKKLNGVWKSLAMLVIYLSAFGLYQFLTLANLPPSWWAVNVASRRITSVLNHPNALALLLGPITAMLITLVLTSKTWARNRLVIIAIILGLATLYLSFSRAAWLALGATIIGISLLIPSSGEGKGRERLQLRLKIIGGILIIGILILAIPYSRAKLLDLASRADPSQQNRFVLWSAARDIIKHNPIYGVGLMGFHEAYKSYPLGPDRVVQNYPHNFFLNFWVEIGLVGMLAMLGLLYIFQKKIRYLWNTPWRPIGIAAAAGMVMIILHGQVDVPYFKNDLAVLFWLIYALPNLGFLEG